MGLKRILPMAADVTSFAARLPQTWRNILCSKAPRRSLLGHDLGNLSVRDFSNTTAGGTRQGLVRSVVSLDYVWGITKPTNTELALVRFTTELFD